MLVLACAAGAVPVTDGRIVGRVAPALRPTSGTQSVASAVDVSNLTVAAAGSVTRSGRYTLAVPPGVFMVTVDKTGRRDAASGFSRIARVRDGRTVSPPRIARRPQRLDGGGLVGGKPVLAVKAFTGAGASAIHGRGLAGMLETDLFLVGHPCIGLVEWMRRADVLAEIRLQQSKYVDPSTRVTPRLVQPQFFVEGSVATNDASISWSIRIRRVASGRIVATHSGTVSWARYLDVTQEIARSLLEQLGTDCLPTRFVGTFTGENRVVGRNSYSGTMTFVRNAKSPAGTVTYRVERVSWRHTFTSETPCRINASTIVTIAKPDPRASVLVIDKRGGARGYRYAITAFFASPRQLTLTANCNGVQTTQPWVPGVALNTRSDEYTDGATIEGRYESAGTASTYTWNLQGSG